MLHILLQDVAGEEGGTLEFKKGEIRKTIEIPLINSSSIANTVKFEVILEEPGGGATFAEETAGGEESCTAKVILLLPSTFLFLADLFQLRIRADAFLFSCVYEVFSISFLAFCKTFCAVSTICIARGRI